jgi:hypothetical protein
MVICDWSLPVIAELPALPLGHPTKDRLKSRSLGDIGGAKVRR